jgi:hypothetical protein
MLNNVADGEQVGIDEVIHQEQPIHEIGIVLASIANPLLDLGPCSF